MKIMCANEPANSDFSEASASIKTDPEPALAPQTVMAGEDGMDEIMHKDYVSHNSMMIKWRPLGSADLKDCNFTNYVVQVRASGVAGSFWNAQAGCEKSLFCWTMMHAELTYKFLACS